MGGWLVDIGERGGERCEAKAGKRGKGRGEWTLDVEEVEHVLPSLRAIRRGGG